MEAGIHPYLHTLFSEPYLGEDGKLMGVIVDNKSGRGIIKAKYFIDATGDGDLCYRLGLKSYAFELTLKGYSIDRIIRRVMKKFPDANPKSIQQWYRAALRKKK